MIVNQENLEKLTTGIQTRYNDALPLAPRVWDRVATAIQSNNKVELYALLSMFPELLEWKSAAAIEEIAAKTQSVANKDHVATMRVKYVDIETDNFGMLNGLPASAAAEVQQFSDRSIFDLLAAAAATPCIDGTPFVGANHVVAHNKGGATRKSNLVALHDGETAVEWWFLMASLGSIKALIRQERVAPDIYPIGLDKGSEPYLKHREIWWRAEWSGAFALGPLWQLCIGSQRPLVDGDGVPTNAFDEAMERMMSMRDTETGKLLGLGGVKPMLVVGSSNRAAARQAVAVPTVLTGGANKNYDQADIIATGFMP